ncbi:MAG: YigZ family protein [Erysipelotrichaceae bacterium]|nr:YigZ family protein [Erysipelotrichaceae bacterium]
MYVKDLTIHTLIIEKSEFITYLNHVESEDEYKEFLSAIRKKHHDASHVCSAFICGNIKRSSDDGEPSGTAGAPILNVLEKNNLDKTCALVVRYFGGIKLGAGGLIRAYSSSVSEALKEAVIIEEAIYPKYALTLPYDLANRINHYLTNNTSNLYTEYSENVYFEFGLDNENKIKTIMEYTKGIKPVNIGTIKVEKIVK